MGIKGETTWTKEEDELLVKYRTEGMSYLNISRHHLPGRSRNACIGRALRLGIVEATKRPVSSARVPRPPRKTREIRVPASAPLPAITLAVTPPPDLADTEPLPPGCYDATVVRTVEPVDIIGLTAHTCRWPLLPTAPQMFCGDVVKAGSVYCTHHHGMAYTNVRVPWQPRRTGKLTVGMQR